MLDSLSIEQVAAYAISGGGPSGIEFAARHPDRVNALILEVAISQTFSIEVSALTMSLLTNPILSWIQGQMLERLPRLAVGQLVKIESTLGSAERARLTADILASPEKLAYLRRVLADAPPFDLLRAGFDNDIEQFGAIEQLPLGQVRCPTLVVHGTHDGDVRFSHAENSAREIAGAELHRVEKGWHLLALSDGAEGIRPGRARLPPRAPRRVAPVRIREGEMRRPTAAGRMTRCQPATPGPRGAAAPLQAITTPDLPRVDVARGSARHPLPPPQASALGVG